MTTFAKLLDEYMNIAGLNDEALANQIGVAKKTINNWRMGRTKRPPSCAKVRKCAYVLKLSPAQRMTFFRTAEILDLSKFKCQLIPVVGIPVIEPYQFFGRQKLLGKIYWAWSKPTLESIAIIGPKRSGKTSILNYLKNITQALYYRSDQLQGWPKDWLPYHVQVAFVDFQDANMSQPVTFMKEILRQLDLDVPFSCNLADFSSILKNELTKPVVILMDNLEIGLKISALDGTFWSNMSSLGSYGQVSFVVTASESPLKLAQTCGKPSPFFKLFAHSLSLGTFTEQEARELLTQSPKSFAPKEIEWMLKESGCWPEQLQLLCDKRLQELLLD